MKKITFLLTLLGFMLSSVQSAFADDAKWTNKGIKTVKEAVSSLENLTTGYYLVRNCGHKSWLKENDNKTLYLDVPLRSDDLTSIQTTFTGSTTYMNYVVHITKSETNNTYTIQTKSGQYLPASLPHGGVASTNATAGNYTIENISGNTFGLKAESATSYTEGGKTVSNCLYADGNGFGQYSGGSFTGWSSTLPAANSNGAYQFYPVELSNAVTATINYTVKGHTVLTVTKGVASGGTITADSYPCLTVKNLDKTKLDADGTVTATCTMTLPIEASTTTSPKYYAVKMHTGSAMWTANTDGSSISCVSTSTSLPSLPAAKQWAFIGTDLFTSFKIYNKETKKYLKSTGSDAATLVESADDATAFRVMATKTQIENGFCIYRGDTYLNYQDDAIKTWYDNDNGSTCTVFTPVSFALNYAADYSNYDDSGAPQGAIGGNSHLTKADNLSAFKNAYNAANTTDATAEQVTALEGQNNKIAAAAATVATVEAGKYYRLYNKKDKKWLCVRSTDNTKMTTDASAGKSAASVVTFVTAESGRFRMMIEGKTFGKRVADDTPITLEADNSDSKGSYRVEHVGTKFTFYDVASNNAHSYLHCNNANGAGNVVGWEAGDAEPSYWYVVPATDVEIALSTVGDSKYATAYLPFPVSAISDAEAFTGELSTDQSTLNMTKIESIPANTGVVLTGSADKATLTIGAATATVSNNALTGTNLDVTLADDTRANYLVLGSHNNTIGFYAPSSSVSKLTANKAYLNASSIASGALKLNFGGNTTGIHTATTANGVNAPIFDLSGRRVATPVKGGVYIQNGKKFIK